MKKIHLYLTIFILLFLPFLPIVSAQEYSTWGLPEGAFARLGKGEITGNLAFSPDGNRLAVASSIGIWIYDMRPGQETELQLITGHTHDVTTLAYSPDGRILASGSRDATIRLWNTVSSKQVYSFKGQEEYKEEVTTLVFSPDGKIICSRWDCLCLVITSLSSSVFIVGWVLWPQHF